MQAVNSQSLGGMNKMTIYKREKPVNQEEQAKKDIPGIKYMESEDGELIIIETEKDLTATEKTKLETMSGKTWSKEA